MKNIDKIVCVEPQSIRVKMLEQFFRNIDISDGAIDLYDLQCTIKRLRTEIFPISLLQEYLTLFDLMDKVESNCKNLRAIL